MRAGLRLITPTPSTCRTPDPLPEGRQKAMKALRVAEEAVMRRHGAEGLALAARVSVHHTGIGRALRGPCARLSGSVEYQPNGKGIFLGLCGTWTRRPKLYMKQDFLIGIWVNIMPTRWKIDENGR
jgi:hypothetical protein